MIRGAFFIPLCASQYRNKEPTILENESGRLFCCLDWEHDPCPALEIGLMKTIKIKDYYGIYQEIPVSDELYEEWRALQNETQRIHRKEVYHRDWTPMDDLEEMPQHFTLNELEDALIWDEQVVELYAAISQLTPIQQRRIRMLMDNMSIREIARREGCHMNAALKSVNGALKKLRGLLQDH